MENNEEYGSDATLNEMGEEREDSEINSVKKPRCILEAWC